MIFTINCMYHALGSANTVLASSTPLHSAALQMQDLEMLFRMISRPPVILSCIQATVSWWDAAGSHCMVVLHSCISFS